MLRLSKTRFYAVPILMRALDVLELLGESDAPLKTNDISTAAKIPPTTTYRILRTLACRGYIVQDIEGRFSKLSGPQNKLLSPRATYSPLREVPRLHGAHPSGDQAVEIVHDILRNLNLLQSLKLEEDGEASVVRQHRKKRRKTERGNT